MGTLVKHSPGPEYWCCPGANLLGSVPVSRFPDVPTNEEADPGEAGVCLEGVVPLGLALRSPPLQTPGGVEKVGLKGLKALEGRMTITEEVSIKNTGLHLKQVTFFCDRHEWSPVKAVDRALAKHTAGNHR